jgi:hypothetical protein
VLQDPLVQQQFAGSDQQQLQQMQAAVAATARRWQVKARSSYEQPETAAALGSDSACSRDDDVAAECERLICCSGF